MELVSNLTLGFSAALSPINLIYCFLGALLGTLIGVLPGIGPAATIAILLPFTMTLEPTTALIMLAGIYYGSQYGGSTTAILVNLPGEASSAVTALDGYQMARQGRAGPALAIAAIGSFVAGCFATLLIAVFATPLTKVALRFGSAEYTSLIVLGLISSVVLASGSVLNAIAMIALGLLLGSVGTDVATASTRFTFGMIEFSDGIDFVAVAVAFFGIAEILRNLESESERSVAVTHIARLMPSRDDLRRSTGPILRGTALGSVLGILPGGGFLLASFASYSLEKKISKHPQEFGKGAIEGVAGPESANNAGAQTSFIPMLTLGLPSNAVMALMFGALLIHGIVPGPNAAIERPDLFWGLIASMWVGNAMLLVLNLPLVGVWVRLLRIPYYFLFPMIIGFSAIGVYAVASNPFHIYAMAALGLLAYVLVKLGCEVTPLLLGFVLGPMLEEHFIRAMALANGDPTTFITRPISAGLLLTAVVLLFLLVAPAISRLRKEVFVE